MITLLLLFYVDATSPEPPKDKSKSNFQDVHPDQKPNTPSKPSKFGSLEKPETSKFVEKSYGTTAETPSAAFASLNKKK